jgi:hypothetical protein
MKDWIRRGVLSVTGFRQPHPVTLRHRTAQDSSRVVNPGHAARVFRQFYFLRGLGPAAFRVIALAELALLLAFLLGVQKRVSYGLVLLLHGVSTVASYRQYLDPFENLLFFAAWPMLAACYALYTLRDLDTIVLQATGSDQKLSGGMQSR